MPKQTFRVLKETGKIIKKLNNFELLKKCLFKN